MQKLPSLTCLSCQSSEDSNTNEYSTYISTDCVSSKYSPLSLNPILSDCQSFSIDLNCCKKEYTESNFSKSVEPITKAMIPKVATSCSTNLSTVIVKLITREQSCQINNCALLEQEMKAKTTNLLVDGDGNEYKKRSPFVWQCTKKTGLEEKKKCPALIREKNGTFFIVNSIHRHNSA